MKHVKKSFHFLIIILTSQVVELNDGKNNFYLIRKMTESQHLIMLN